MASAGRLEPIWRIEGFWALTIYRLQKAGRRCRRLWMLIRVALRIANKLLTVVTNTNIHPDAQVDPGSLILMLASEYMAT
jgi:serine acetyltransferase